MTLVQAWRNARADHPILLTLLFAIAGTLLAIIVDAAIAAPVMLGAVTLAQSADLEGSNMLRRGVIEKFVESSAVLSRIPFMEIEGNAYQYSAEASLPGIAFRAVNAAYTESTGAVVNAVEGLKILGGDADVDRFIQKTRSRRVDQVGFQTGLKAKAAAIKFTESFFEGDSAVDVDSFDGLRTRLVGGQVLTAGAGGAALTLSMVDDLIAAVDDPDVIFLNEWLIRKINALVRATGGTTPEPQREYGRLVSEYAGIPLVTPGKGLDGVTDILGFDETQGGSNVASSMYAVRWGEDEYLAGLTNGGIDVYPLGELETKPAFRVRIEWYAGLALFRSRAAARLRGVTKT
jgi:hypothetical protein